MEENKNANDISNISAMQNVSATEKTTVSKKKTASKKIILLIVFVAVVLLIIGGVVYLLSERENKTKEMLSNLGIDDYFKYVLTTDYKKDINLLDINNEEQMFMYYYYNKNTKIYKIDFQDPTYKGTLFLTYAKYDEYMKYHEKVFGVQSKHQMSIYDIDIPGLNSVGNDVYNPENVPIQCQYADNTNNCYIKLTKDIDNKGEVELRNLKLKDNVVTGTVSFKSKTENFKFIFKKVNDKNIIKELRIVDSLEN